MINPDAHIQSDIKHLFDHIFLQKHQLDYTLLKKYVFVLEACEYKEHFLLYDTDYSLITNIEWDHVDYYTTVDQYRRAFVDKISKTRFQSIITPLAVEQLKDSVLDQQHYVISKPYMVDCPYLIGSYTADNAGLVKALLSLWVQDGKIQYEDEQLRTVLYSFKGVGRRMEYLGQREGKSVYSDYGHHAPALEGNISALRRQFPDKKLTVIFQPHQAQRVLAGWDDFAQALQDVDQVIIYRLYTARETFEDLVSHYPRLQTVENFEQLGQLFAEHVHGSYVHTNEELKALLQQNGEDNIIVYFSAGDLDGEIRKWGW